MFKQAVILAGGKGTRFLEQTKFMPKPMIRAKKIPLLIHIINQYKKYDINDFYILTGYKQEIINDYFLKNSNYEIQNDSFVEKDGTKVSLVDTGEETLTGGRLLIAMEKFNFENFYLTYGDGISDINLRNLTDFHIQSGKIGTITAVNPPPRFGNLEIKNDMVVRMREKEDTLPSWINGGFFVFNNKIKKYITKDEPFEQEPLNQLSLDGELSAFKHTGYWQCVDTIRELEVLESDIDSKKIIV